MIPDCSSEVNFSKMSIKLSGRGWSIENIGQMIKATIIQHLTSTGMKGKNRSQSSRWQTNSIRQTAPTLSVKDLIQRKRIALELNSIPQPQSLKVDMLCQTMADQTKISILGRLTTSRHLRRIITNSTRTLKTIKRKLSTSRTDSGGSRKKIIRFI